MSAPHTPIYRSPAFIIAAVILGASAIGMSTALQALNIHLQKKPINAPGDRTLLAVPAQTPSWIREGTDRIETAEVIETLGTQNYVSRLYRLKDAPADKPVFIDFHAAYYTGMIDTVPHVPERCFVGGGLQIESGAVTIPVPLDSSRWLPKTDTPEDLKYNIHSAPVFNEHGAVIRRPRLPRGINPDGKLMMRVTRFTTAGAGASEQRPLYAGYFFIANGGTVASAEDVRFLAFNLTDDYAYYLKVQFTSNQVDSPEELAQKAGKLLDELLGDIMLCVPDWIEVQRGLYPPDNPKRPVATASTTP